MEEPGDGDLAAVHCGKQLIVGGGHGLFPADDHRGGPIDPAILRDAPVRLGWRVCFFSGYASRTGSWKIRSLLEMRWRDCGNG